MGGKNPNARPISGLFYFVSDQLHTDGALVKKGPEENDACLVASESIDDCLALDGLGFAYRVQGTTCSHYWPHSVSYAIKNVFGGYYNGLTTGESYPPTAHQFDELKIIGSIPTDEFFGPNGRQVSHVIDWIRSKTILTNESIDFVPGFKLILNQVMAYYSERLSSALWPRREIHPIAYGPKQLTSQSMKVWLRPWRLARAWEEAYSVALQAERVNRCAWLRDGSPALIALALRDRLRPPLFTELYAGLEPYYPIATLDSEVKGTLYKVYVP